MNRNNPPGVLHCVASSEKGSQLSFSRQKRNMKWIMGHLFSSVALPLQDPITAEGPSSQQHRFYPHSSPNTFNGGCRKVLEISRSPQWLWRRRKGKSHSRYHIPFFSPRFRPYLVFFLQNDFTWPQPQPPLSPGICLCPSPQTPMSSPGSGFISWQTIRIWRTRMMSKVIYRMSSNWQAPPLFFNALGMIYILIIIAQQRGKREGLLGCFGSGLYS